MSSTKDSRLEPSSRARDLVRGAWERMFANIRATGPQRSFIATDLGQPGHPLAEDGLTLMADYLLAAGFSEAEVITMAVTNTVRLATG